MPEQSTDPLELKRQSKRDAMRRFRANHPGYHQRFHDKQREYRNANRERLNAVEAARARAKRAANRPAPDPDLSNEHWLAIDGFEGIYAVSDLGRVRNVQTGRVLRPYRSGSGYLGVALWRDRKPNRITVHRLVAKAFLDVPGKGRWDANHIDGDKHNNARANLEWLTHIENAAHARRTGLMATGNRLPHTKLNEGIAREIRASTDAQPVIAQRYGVSRSLVGMIINRKRWAHVV